VAFEIDTSTAFGVKVLQRIENQKLAWLTTVAKDATPQPNPVWFLWDNGSFIVFSKPKQAKLANIARSGRVSVNLEATSDEEQITIFIGAAEHVDRSTIGPEIFDRYAAKYVEGFANIGMTRAEYEAAYSEVIRVTPEKLRGW
jgi:PPOX class probable F420-dependent enzyme